MFWDIGTMEQKEQLLEAVFGTMRSRQGTHCHVATSPRRDVPTSRRRVNHAEVNDVSTSRRHHVATSARKSASHHLMSDGSEIRASGGVRSEARISRARGSRLREECPGFVPLSIFVRFIENMMMMFLRLDTLFFSFMMF